MIVRFDGPLYTANVRSANRKLLAPVDARESIDTLVVDSTAVAMVPVTVLDEPQQLQDELAARSVSMWIAGMPPRTLDLARRAPHWDEFESRGRVFPTALAAARAYQAGQR